MKRKNIFVVLMIAIMVLGGCGSKKTEEAIANTNTVKSSVETEQEELDTKSETVDINSLIVEKTDEELVLKQYLYSYEDRTMDKEGEQVFYENLFDSNPETFVTTGNVDIYNINGIRVGYALKDILIDSFGEYKGWYYFYLDGNKRFARAEDIKANSQTLEQANAEEQAKEEAFRQEYEERNNTEQKPSTPVVKEPVAQPAETVVTDSDKYTPDEAIAVYRSLIEAGGIIWDPSLKGVTSWGTGIIYLDKGYAELVASSDLESFSFNDGTGHHTTKYYIEVTGSDEEAVYFTGWRN